MTPDMLNAVLLAMLLVAIGIIAFIFTENYKR